MKKPFILILILLFLYGISSAQVKFGPSIGMTFSKFNFSFEESDYVPDVKFKIGPSVGGILQVPLSEHFLLQPALLFTKKGASWDLKKLYGENNSITSYDGYIRWKIGYIEIPVHVAASFNAGPGNMQIFVGPYIAFACVGKYKYDIQYKTVSGNEEDHKASLYYKFKNKVSESDWDKYEDDDDFRDFLKIHDIGLNFGAGYQVSSILVNVGYSMGFTNLIPKYEDEDETDDKFSNRVIFVNIAWLFSCKK